MKKIILVIFTLLICTPAQAITLGLGAVSCVTVGQDFKRVPRQAKQMYYTWFAGFASGVNQMSDRQKNLKLNMDDRWAQLARYCNEHPLAYFYVAARHVILTIPYEDEPKATWEPK